MLSIGTSIALALWAAVCILDLKCFKIALLSRPLLAGFGAGIICGNIPLGLTVGSTLELMSMGIWNYGGATIPDYTCATIVSIAIATATGTDFNGSIAIAIPVALLFTYFDILAMTYNTFYQHKADKYCEEGNVKALERMHPLGYLTWAISRGLPVFLACFFGSWVVNAIFNVCPEWVFTAIGKAGGIFPALGIALLLKMMPAKKYWMFLILGYVLAAYFDLGFIGITLCGAVAVGITELSKRQQGQGPQKTKALDL
ncbi:MAG: PTS sugar transporter subunit IIC [Atopobium sp.]|jgi:PTS system mannose-specific IIC component|nr:PTS sugar transporter subunit IIC [Atopobium sp.]